jgi:hypothetical protein
MYCFLCFTVLSGLYAQDSDTVTWKMAVRRWTGSAYESVSFRGPIQMKLGDAYQISIESGRDCYCYALKQDSNGMLSILSNSPLRAKSELVLPSSEEDFEIPSTGGTERFYIIISAHPQASFEKVLKSISGKGEASTDAVSKVQDELLRIKQSLTGVATEAEKPAAMGGVTRGSVPQEATQFEGRSLYVKTITIKH